MFVSGWWTDSWMLWDALQSSWNDWVIDFDETRQRELAGEMHERSQRMSLHVVTALERLSRWAAEWEARIRKSLMWLPGTGVSTSMLLLAVALSAAGLAFIVWVWLRPRLIVRYRSRRLSTGRGRIRDCSYLYERAVRLLNQRGYRRQTWQTAEEFVESVEEVELCRLMRGVNSAYNAARFGEDRSAMKQLPNLVAALERGR